MRPLDTPPASAVKLLDDIVAGGWPADWLDSRIAEGDGYDLLTVTIEDRSVVGGDIYWASWTRSARSRWRWRFMYAHNGWNKMTIKELRTYVCSGPVEVSV